MRKHALLSNKTANELQRKKKTVFVNVFANHKIGLPYGRKHMAQETRNKSELKALYLVVIYWK